MNIEANSRPHWNGGEGLTIHPRILRGTVTPPPSKSLSHRHMIAGVLAGLPADPGPCPSRDLAATAACLSVLGGGGEELPLLDCGESGSTLRFLIPAALVLRGGARFTGSGRLMERPQQPYFDLFAAKGIACCREENILTVSGSLVPGTYLLPGNVSSQFITGLLFALPLLEGPSEIILTTPLESRGYVDMTLDVLDTFGIRVDRREDGVFLVPGGQKYLPRSVEMEADWSQAAFWYAANFLDNRVEIGGLNPRSRQGDMAIASHYWDLARPGDMELDVSQYPDLVPPLALMAAVRRGTTRLVNAARLRMKESDRLAAVTVVLNALGARVEEHPDSLTIRDGEGLAGGVAVDCCNDHRIAMMAAIAATRCAAPITLLGAECVNKSYPGFWKDYAMLGGEIHGLVSGQ